MKITEADLKNAIKMLLDDKGLSISGEISLEVSDDGLIAELEIKD